MSALRPAPAVLDRDFLEIRARILEVAAALDRLDRAPHRPEVAGDRRLGLIQRALEALVVAEPGRAEAIQTLFSLAYDPDWQSTFAMDRR